MPLLCWGACKWSLLRQAASGCTSPLLPWREGSLRVFPQGLSGTLLSFHRLGSETYRSPIASFDKVGHGESPNLGQAVSQAGVMQEQACFMCLAAGTACPKLGLPPSHLVKGLGLPGCHHWPYIVTLCSQQSFVPAEA